MAVMSDKKWAHLAGPELLRRWRDGQRLTQQNVADLIGVDLQSYNAFERGRERPGLVPAVAIERVTKGRVKAVHWTSQEARP